MTHSSHSARQAAINAFAFETALSSIIMDEKEYLANLDTSDPLFEAKFTPRFALLRSLEEYRRCILTGTPSDEDCRDINALVRHRMGGDVSA